MERVLGESQPDVKSPPRSSVHPAGRLSFSFVGRARAIEFRGGPRTKSAGPTSNPLKHRSAHRRGRHQGRDLNGLIGRGRCSQWRRLGRRHSIGCQPCAAPLEPSRISVVGPLQFVLVARVVRRPRLSYLGSALTRTDMGLVVEGRRQWVGRRTGRSYDIARIAHYK